MRRPGSIRRNGYRGIGAGALESRLVVIDAGQSNKVGAGSLKIGIPADHDRHGSRALKLNASSVLVASSESLHEGIDPYLDAAPTEGFGSAKVGANDWLDARPGQVIIIPCALSGSSLTNQWKVSPGDGSRVTYTIERALSVIRPLDRVLLYWYQGESEAGAQATAEQVQERTQALWDRLRTALNRPTMPVIYCRLTATPAAGFEAWWPTVRTEQAALQSSTQVMIDPPDSGGTLHLNFTQQISLGHTFGTALLNMFA